MYTKNADMCVFWEFNTSVNEYDAERLLQLMILNRIKPSKDSLLQIFQII